MLKGDSARPVKLQFADEKSKWDFIKRVNSQLRDERLFCKLDTNAQIRNQEYKLRQQVKVLKQTNEGSEYRVRDLVIQHKNQTTGEWENVNPKEVKKDTQV